MRDLTVSLLQADLHWQEPAANRAAFSAMLEQLDPRPALAVLPEMFTTGFTMETASQAETMDGPSIAWLSQQAKTRGITLTGSLIIRDGDRYFNRLIWMPPDGNLGYYDKRHLFRMAGEHEHFAAGRSRPIFDLDDWRVCPLVCYDLRFPVWSRGVDAYDLLIYVANWPAARRSAWTTLLPARAVENLCYSIGVNRSGSDGNGIAYAGDSGAWNYLGQPLASAGSPPGIITVTLDAAALARYRERFPAHLDADHYDLKEG